MYNAIFNLNKTRFQRILDAEDGTEMREDVGAPGRNKFPFGSLLNCIKQRNRRYIVNVAVLMIIENFISVFTF